MMPCSEIPVYLPLANSPEGLLCPVGTGFTPGLSCQVCNGENASSDSELRYGCGKLGRHLSRSNSLP